MAARLTATAKILQHLFQRAFKGLPPDVAEPEGPFFDEQEQEWYDLLRTLRGTSYVPPIIVPPTFYQATLQSYTTTPADFEAKCGAGKTGNAVTRTSSAGSSSVSQQFANAQALAAAKAAALDAIVCPVVITYTGTYQTTPADYQAKCGQGTSGASVSRSATSTVDQATADAAAKADALNAIVCPVPFPNYSTTLTQQVPVDPSGEVTLTLGDPYPDGVFKFNASPGGDSTAKTMIVNINGSFGLLLDFPATYTNTATPWTFEAGGKRYTGSFVDGTTNANLYN